MMPKNNSNLDLVNFNAHTNFVKFYQFVLKISSRNKIMTLIKSHNSVTNLQKMMCNDPDLHLVNIYAYTKFGKILSICSQDIERKVYYDG